MFKRILGTIAAMFALGTSQVQAANHSAPAPVEMRKQRRPGVTHNVNDPRDYFPSGKNPYKHYWPDLNQRQYRKLVRQVPNIRRSKKCRIKSK